MSPKPATGQRWHHHEQKNHVAIVVKIENGEVVYQANNSGSAFKRVAQLRLPVELFTARFVWMDPAVSEENMRRFIEDDLVPLSRSLRAGLDAARRNNPRF